MWHFDAMHYESKYYITFRLEYTECILLCMLFRDTDSLFEYMRILSLSRIKSNDHSTDILKTILHKIEEDMKSNARLKYVNILKLTFGHIMGQ